MATEARGILFDLPHIVAGAHGTLEAYGIATRCELVGGDFFTSVPPGGDVYLMKLILHDWDDARAARILAACRAAMVPGAELVLVDMIVPSDHRPSVAPLMDIHMLVMHGGCERTASEYRALVEGAGFRIERIAPTAGPVSVIVAHPVA